MQLMAEQQRAHVPGTKAKHEIETPMDVNQDAKDTGSGIN
jgi:hypothetical protein